MNVGCTRAEVCVPERIGPKMLMQIATAKGMVPMFADAACPDIQYMRAISLVLGDK